MALHCYKIWIEYADPNTGYHPVNVYVKAGDSRDAPEIADYHGRKLQPLLNKAARFIVEQEQVA